MEEFTVEKIVELLRSRDRAERCIGALIVPHSAFNLGEVVTCLNLLNVDCEKRIELVYEFFPWLEIPSECEDSRRPCSICWDWIVQEAGKSKSVNDVLEVGDMDAA